jgi:hypothetical protein
VVRFTLNRSPDNRNAISLEAMEAAITAAVKKADAACERFVGVILRRTNPRSRIEDNWEIRGVMFGDADRKKASDALATIVERMQLEFKISDNPRIKNSSTEVG